MSTTSRILAVSAAAMLLGGCLPGPWDYAPDNRPAFRGVTMTAYAIAGRPARDVCFERLLRLDEAYTDARPWYDSASVGISGTFSTGPQTLVLTPRPGPANCFAGPSGALFLRGEDYAITARFVWDSAGARTVSTLTATARVPDVFAVSDTAHAPAFALTGNAAADPRDPAGYALVPYRDGDSVFYLPTRNNLSELPHYFKARAGADVRAVLITRTFDSTASRPETSFDTLGGFIPKIEDFYQPGTTNRVSVYFNFPLPGGRTTLDSMGFFNALFWSGRNRLFFYGMEKIYADYLSALSESEGSAKIRLPTNVTGGRGFFAGMIVDSFTVNLKLDGTTQAFPYAVTRAAACSDKGWFANRDCIVFYRDHCRATDWKGRECRLDGVYAQLDPVDSASAPAWLADSAGAWAAADPLLPLEARRRFCIENDYPAGKADCAPIRAECETGAAGNGCQLVLWTRCQVGYWDTAALPACAEGLKSYCSVRRDIHKSLCRDVPSN